MKLRTLLALVAAVMVVFALAVSAHRRRVDRAWSAMLVQLDELEAERRAYTTVRDALYGETVDEGAWPHYALALAELDGIEDLVWRARTATYPFTDELREDRDRLLDGLDGFYEHLRAGAHARDATRRVGDGADDALATGALIHGLSACELAAARFYVLLEDGDDVGAVEALLDGLQLARDLCGSPLLADEMQGTFGLVPQTLPRVLAERGAMLSTEAKTLYVDGLDAVLAAVSPVGPALYGELESVGRGFADQLRDADDHIWSPGDSDWPSWRHGLSLRASVAESIDLGVGNIRRIRDVLAGPVERIRPELARLELEAASHSSWIHATVSSKATQSIRFRRSSLTRLGLLRHALALDLGLRPEPVLEPFGQRVRSTVTAEQVEVWLDGDEDHAIVLAR